MNITITNKQLSSVLFKSTDKNSNTILEYLKKQYDFSKVSDSVYQTLQAKLDRHFIPTFTKKYKYSIYSEERFLNNKNNLRWLVESFTFSYTASEKTPKKYADVCTTTKRKKINEVLDDIPVADLLNACNKRIRRSNETDSELNDSSNSGSFKNDNLTSLSPDEALAMSLDAKLSKFQYCIIRKNLREKGINALPEYRHITKAKEKFCPDFIVTETSGSTKLQAILDHSAESIVKIENTKKAIIEKGISKLEMISKYGCDGTSGFTQYKQAFSESKSLEGNHVFIICTVPIFLRYSERRHNVVNFWQNKNPSSTRLCRPVKFTYEKESAELINLEMADIQKQIRKLTPTKIVIDGHEIVITHTLYCTMLDGKVRQVLTETISSQRCSLCDALPSEMNNLEKVLKKEVKKDACSFGLSTLHAWIRNLEWVLHLSYKVLAKVEKYNVQLTDEEKKEIQSKKNEVIEGISEKLNMLVDTVKQAAGNTN